MNFIGNKVKKILEYIEAGDGIESQKRFFSLAFGYVWEKYVKKNDVLDWRMINFCAIL